MFFAVIDEKTPAREIGSHRLDEFLRKLRQRNTGASTQIEQRHTIPFASEFELTLAIENADERTFSDIAAKAVLCVDPPATYDLACLRPAAAYIAELSRFRVLERALNR